MAELSKVYDPSQTEDKWYKLWEEKGCFKADENDAKAEPFAVVIPPPNVTGQLTLGHVLNNTIQDILVRKKRMEGKNVLWLPGTDHAGIATQNVVERAIQTDEKKSRHDIGREEFLKRVWAWKDKYGSTIIQQLKRLGCSCDWTRLRFTMDEGYSNAVKEVFVSLYEKGMVYRGEYIINWCPRCLTALSDEENEHQERQGRLWHIQYPLADGSGHLTVATTRPETMLGDTAVAVHPDDGRYQPFIGRTVRLPLADRDIPVIADAHVDPAFGTGCVKVTPAHDPNDFAIGGRHKLEKLNILNPDATLNDRVPAKYRGMERFACRKAVVQDLSALGLLVKTEDHVHSVGHCERCNTVTEPYLSTQWFVKYDAWVKPALSALADKKLFFFPEKYERIFVHWLENIRDWCISRQLWWGHRVPVWYCGCGEVIVARSAPGKCPKCAGTNLRQDEDVLDTWFSSWLWPFATMGWPEKTPLLGRFYPTQTLVTAADIIFFWVARMVFAGFEFMGRLPFSRVYFTSIVRDLQGRKMSKSLGNSPDPIAVMDQYGADALRYTIVAMAPTGQDVIFSEDKCELGRNFANKLWNTARFALMHLPRGPVEAPAAGAFAPEDLWIRSRYHRAIDEISAGIETFHFSEALGAAYRFVWNELCDWYVEFIKPRLADGADAASRQAALFTLGQALTGAIRLLHPFMPFITEEIHSVLMPPGGGPLMTSAWPKSDPACVDPKTEACVDFVREVVSSIRNLRAEQNIPPSKKGSVVIHAEDAQKREWLNAVDSAVRTLSKTDSLAVSSSAEKPASAATAVTSGVTIYLNLEGMVDKKAEREKILKAIDKARGFLAAVEKKLGNEKFLKNAPKAVLAKEEDKRADTREKIRKLEENLKMYE